jgi:hypothetical protein
LGTYDTAEEAAMVYDNAAPTLPFRRQQKSSPATTSATSITTTTIFALGGFNIAKPLNVEKEGKRPYPVLDGLLKSLEEEEQGFFFFFFISGLRVFWVYKYCFVEWRAKMEKVGLLATVR